MNLRLPCSLIAAASLWAGVAHASPPADPTRPPGWSATPASGVARAAAPAAPAPLRVQSVQVPRSGPASALVDNKLLFVGDRLGAATVVAIDTQGLQLRNAHGRIERLSLFDTAHLQRHLVPAGNTPAPVATLAGGQQP